MYVSVLVEIKAKQVDKPFTYKVPNSLLDKIKIGQIVKVPFGKKKLEGYVIDIIDETDVLNVKEIEEIVFDEPVLKKEIIELGKYLQNITLRSLSSCYSIMLPKGLKAKIKDNVNIKYETYLIKKEYKDILVSSKGKEILELFNEREKILKKEANNISISATKTLINKNILEEVKEEVYRYEINNKIDYEKKVLNEEQENAYERICSSLNTSKTILLHGVTGSGKTEVYLSVIESVLKLNKTALVLVPEISLTPQFVARFNSRFKNNMAVLHSGLSDGEKYDEWRKITNKEVNIVIGTRSAIFAPLENIGIIIIDEEHSESYKQENNPKYHAIDIAKERSKYNNCPLVLGSATPSLNTFARAIKKKYDYIKLTKRALGANLPNISLVDMTEEIKNNHPIISRELEYEIIKRLNNNEQVILLLNRRGHSTTITCSNCGFTYKCPYCDISLTYHKTSGNARCHYCGYTKYVTDVCPTCNEKSLNYYGLGTEKLEDYIKEIFPRARVLRMDADTTKNKGEFDKITNSFYKEEYDILIGTQMVSKGLDFPKVTLVGILNADQSLNVPEYKSNEKTFSLLAQTSGRAGRDKIEGNVIIQTYNPEHPILTFIKENSYEKFVKYEMNLRKTLKYPPYYYLVEIKLKSKNYQELCNEIKKVKGYLERNILNTSIILGPTPSNPFLVNNIYSFGIIIKYQHDDTLKKYLKELDNIYKVKSDFILDIDFFY